ncbi:hypothetical protein HQN90_15790 [Paenibacillus alba]|nr:hypothetical protein [Paenibacillus alba]
MGVYWKHTDEAKAKISEFFKGKARSDEVRKKISDSHKGKKLSEQHRLKLSEVKTGKKLNVDRRGEKANRAILNELDVIEIRRLYATDKSWTHRSLAKKYGVGKSTITAILSNKSWSHI